MKSTFTTFILTVLVGFATFFSLATGVSFGQPRVIVPGFAEQEIARFEWTYTPAKHMRFATPSIAYENDSAKRGFHVYPFRTASTWNSGYARGFNDGAVWKGKGLTQEIHGGFSWQNSFLNVVFHPVLFYSQNRWFRFRTDSTSTRSPFSYPFFPVDYVVRFGDKPFFGFHPGQSEISVKASNVRFGITTQNVVLGPAHHYPLLMSTQAGGFPQAFVTLVKPIDIVVGFGDFRQFWGRLNESDYFDSNPANNGRYITGLSLGFRPHFLPNLHFGVNRVAYRRGENFDLNLRSLTASLQTRLPQDGLDPQLGNNYYDQLISLTSHYALPDRGFELYWEYAKNDHGGLILGAPEDSRAFVLGTGQFFILPDGEQLGFVFELTDLSTNLMTFNRSGGGYYAHSVVEQGFTHNGQLIGAGIGPGSNSKKYKAYFKNRRWYHGIYFEMIQYDNDSFYREFFQEPLADDYRDTEHSYGYNLRYSGRGYQVEWSIIMAYRPTPFFEGHGWHYNLQNRLAISF